MLPKYLIDFNKALDQFQDKFPKDRWTEQFQLSLINDYTFFSARVEDSKLQYGDTIRFLNDETIRSVNFKSLLRVSDHQSILKGVIDNLQDFELTESTIKNLHAELMENPIAWQADFKPGLVGQYRNIPTVGSRKPLSENKEYAPHYNLEIIMSSYIPMFVAKFDTIDNKESNKHLLTAIAYFHNKFLNEIHPFADGNGRICRIIIGAVLMQNNCPPIFPEIKTQEQQIEYINTIIACEKNKSDKPLIIYFAEKMSAFLQRKILTEIG